MVLTSFTLVGSCFLIGRFLNKRLANKWLDTVRPALKDAFAVVGSEVIEKAPYEVVVFEDSTSHEFSIKLAGRQSTKYADFSLSLKKRHDISTMLFTQVPLVGRLF